MSDSKTSMSFYQANIDLPTELSPEFVAMIPKQRTKVNELMGEGKIRQYSLSLDRSKLWVTFLAESEESVMDMIATFPMVNYMKFEIVALAFHEQVTLSLPKVSLN